MGTWRGHFSACGVGHPDNGTGFIYLMLIEIGWHCESHAGFLYIAFL